MLVILPALIVCTCLKNKDSKKSTVMKYHRCMMVIVTVVRCAKKDTESIDVEAGFLFDH